MSKACPLCKGSGKIDNHQFNQDMRLKVLELREAGLTYREIAKTVGLKSPDTVSYYLKGRK